MHQSGKRRAEVEEVARMIFELTIGENINIEDATYGEQEAEFIRRVAPKLLQWEREILHPYIEKILQMDWERLDTYRGTRFKKNLQERES